jgi:hypothetical protein
LWKRGKCAWTARTPGSPRRTSTRGWPLCRPCRAPSSIWLPTKVAPPSPHVLLYALRCCNNFRSLPSSIWLPNKVPPPPPPLFHFQPPLSQTPATSKVAPCLNSWITGQELTVGNNAISKVQYSQLAFLHFFCTDSERFGGDMLRPFPEPHCASPKWSLATCVLVSPLPSLLV